MFGGGGATFPKRDATLFTGAGGGDNAVLRLADQVVFLMFKLSASSQFR